MIERDGYIPGVPCWIGHDAADPESAVDFYGGLFGWEFEDMMPPGSPGKYFIARLHSGDVAAVGSQPEGAPPMAVWNTTSGSRAPTRRRPRWSGRRSVLMDPFDVMGAGRMAVFADPRAPRSAPGRRRSTAAAKIVNEPGSLNFNNLNTRASRRARSLLRVGGSAGPTLDMGGGFSMWTLPGYGDHLEQKQSRASRGHGRDGPRRRASRTWSPALNPISDDQPDVPPHWGVTFAVETPTRNCRAGHRAGRTGRPLPPFDAPWVRDDRSITDPQGATFTAEQVRCPRTRPSGGRSGAAISGS